jgi:hypothetical protein
MLTRETIGDFKVALSEALRTTDQEDPTLRERFVELRTGTIGTLLTDVNQLPSGRRGVGKSTTLAVLQQEAEKSGRRVISVEIESHKLRAYPDVLTEIMLDVLGALRPSWSFRKRPRLVRRNVRYLEEVLSVLRDAGPEVTHDDERSSDQLRERKVSLTGAASKKFLLLSGAASFARRSASRTRSSTSYSKRKEDFLRDLAPALSSTLGEAAGLSEKGSMLVVLYDFYMIERRNQPLVLDHLHGITKRTKVWLKIASVKSRTQTFINGDPPIGMRHRVTFIPYRWT